MALSKQQQQLVEAVQSLLNNKAKLGLAVHDKDTTQRDINTFQYLHENIEGEFGLATIDSEFHNGICAAFHKVHSYKYITDPSFGEALTRELNAQGIPAMEQKMAFDAIGKILNEYKGKNGAWAEKDAGWNPDLAKIIEASQPEQFNG